MPLMMMKMMLIIVAAKWQDLAVIVVHISTIFRRRIPNHFNRLIQSRLMQVTILALHYLSFILKDCIHFQFDFDSIVSNRVFIVPRALIFRRNSIVLCLFRRQHCLQSRQHPAIDIVGSKNAHDWFQYTASQQFRHERSNNGGGKLSPRKECTTQSMSQYPIVIVLAFFHNDKQTLFQNLFFCHQNVLVIDNIIALFSRRIGK
mmetsp:Transcript_15808/g.28562  ORF Transcript_15808/g.28562 Transcript_15808/m.28562 type:complete len:203 (-) Transcript_15808:56-664(-)